MYLRLLLLGLTLLAWNCHASYVITVPSGISSIANHLNNGGNTLPVVLPTVPDGTVLYKWNCAIQGYDVYTYFAGLGWFDSGSNPATSVTLAPGEGAFINNPVAPFNLTFNGTVPTPVLPLPLPCGCGQLNLVSAQTTNAPATFADITGVAPEEGTEFIRMIGGVFVTNTFTSGAWDMGAPTANLGEAVFVLIPCPCLEVQCAPNKTVACDTNWIFDAPVVISNCCTGGVNVAVTSTTTNGACPQVITRVWELSNLCTNVVTCTQTVTVVDTSPPVVICANNKTVECGSVWSFDLPTAFDNCCESNLTYSLISSNMVFSDPCTTVWAGVWEVSDCCSNAATCVQLVTVVDSTPPIITCAPDKTVLAGTAWSFDPPNAIDDCCDTNVAIAVISTTTNFFANPCSVLYTRTWLATDCCTNTATCSQTVTVDYSGCQVFNTGMTGPNGDVPIPAGGLDPNFILIASLPGAGSDSVVGGVLSGAWLPNTSESQWIGPDFDTSLDPVGPYLYRLQFILCCTNNAQLSGRIAADDLVNVFLNGNPITTVPPPAYTTWAPLSLTSGFVPGLNTLDLLVSNSIVPFTGLRAELTNCAPELVVICPPDKTIECGTNWDFDLPIASSCCGTNISITALTTITNNSSCPLIVTRTWSIVDACNNTNFCAQTVTIADTSPPIVNCAGAKTVECGSAWSFDPPSAFDLCCSNDLTITLQSSNLIATAPCSETWEGVWLIADCCTNSVTCTQLVTVVDLTPPVVNCPPDKTVECGTMWTFDLPDALDACCGTNVSSLLLDSNQVVFGQCTNVWAGLWQISDCCGNSLVCTQFVTVIDSLPPVVTCPPDKTVSCDVTWGFDPPTAVDLCCDTNIAIQFTGSSLVYSSACTNIWEGVWQISDCCGNSLNCTQQVSVVDLTPPLIFCPPDIVLFSCTNIPVFYSVTATDTCSTVTIVCTPPSGSLFQPGLVTTVHCVAFDACGNTNSCDFDVTVIETQPLALFNTGVDNNGIPLPPFSIDSHYSLPGPQPSGGPDALIVNPLPGGWLPNNSTSAWISPTNTGLGTAGVYVYETQFNLPCTNNVVLSGQWSVDDFGAIVLNGGLPAATISSPGASGLWHPFTISSGFVPGLNTLNFYVTNLFAETGLRVELSGTADCCTNSCLEILCPTNQIIVACTNVPLSYNVSVTNHCTTNSSFTTLVCWPPPGSYFAPNTTTLVNCTASDVFGNSVHCSFTVQIIPPTLSISLVGTNVVITWTGGGVLQEASSIFGPWSDLPSATSPYTVPLPFAATKFYRLRCN